MHSDLFARAYALGPPRQLLTSKFIDESISWYKYEEVVKSWMDNTKLFVSTPTNAYPFSWFREPFSLLVAMFCHWYGSPICTMFQAKWLHVEHHVLITGDSFNWAQVLSFNFKDEIEKYYKTLASRKSAFYMPWFVMDAFYATSPFPALNWNWDKNCPPIHIYCFDMWEDNFILRSYEICGLFLSSMYYKIFKADALAFSERARTLISLHGDWDVGEYFSYIRIWGIY